MSKKTHHEIVDVRPGADFASLLVLSGEPHAILYADRAESLAIALVQATPGDLDLAIARGGMKPAVAIGGLPPFDLNDWIEPEKAIALGLALIRAAGRAKEAK